MRRASSFLAIATILSACSPMENTTSKPDFSSGEHLILGDNGYKAACAGNPALCPAQLIRNDGKQSFSYGELVAFSGDFYGSADEIWNEKEKSALTWKRNDIGDVKDNFKKEVETIENFLHGHSDEKYPDFNTSNAWNFPDYLTLALANAPHFGFYNMIAYVDYHGRALTLALEAHRLSASKPAEAQKLFTQALFTNAFADHFLTDGFAAGHIRDPRVQILNWANARGMSDSAAGTLAKVIHDRDGEVRLSGEHGLNVSNAQGQQWFTRCDSQLFWQNSMQDPSVQLPMQAVQTSVGEVIAAYEDGISVNGVYAASTFVPFPAAQERELTQLFSADMPEAAYDRIIEQMAFYTKIKAFSGVDKSVLKQLTHDLPQIMQSFRNDVGTELRKNPVLMQRLPAAYIEAYRNIK